MAFAESYLDRDFSLQGIARKKEQDFIQETLDAVKGKASPDALQNRLAYIVASIDATLYGIAPKEDAPFKLPENPKASAEVKEMWKCLIGPTKQYCAISARKIDEKRFRCILLRMHDRLFQGVRNSVLC
ncbi:MAG: hypothetical protein ACAH17_01690 [Candidatus Paceibacterota bacterium]